MIALTVMFVGLWVSAILGDPVPVNANARVVAGSVFGKCSRVGMFSEWFYAEVILEPGRAAPLDPDYEERSIYLVEGEVEVAGESFEAPRLLIFRPGDRITVRAKKRARLILPKPSAFGLAAAK